LGLTGAVVVAGLVASERDASACGACFAPQGETNSVVTDHRMVLSVSPQQTTLYDQIRYSGSPSSFAWVLPIAGQVEIGLSADILFGALDILTQTQVVEPPRNCPAPPASCQNQYGEGDSFGSRAPSAGFADAGSSGGGGVSVIAQQTVGPYETVQLRSTDPNALNDWLTQHGYSIPQEMQPVIAAYVADHYDFLALKLVPGAGVQSMRPVRVTSKGASPVMPLRMVAGGTGQTVGITLWVIGEGRYEPQNFEFFHIEDKDIVWDWATSSSNYKDLRAAQTKLFEGKAWEIESATQLQRFTFENAVQFGGRPMGGGTVQGNDYEPIKDANGNIVKTADQVRQLDMDTLFAGIAQGQEHVTRVRADLARAALGSDLVLQASADQALLSNVRQPKQEKGSPQCPIYQNCVQVGLGTREEAQQAVDAYKGNGKESFSCATAGKSSVEWSVTFSALAGFVGIAALRRRKNNKKA
jgi:hypothetical protein